MHVFKKRLVNAQEINSYFKSNPDVSRRIGTLPSDFFEHIDKQQKSIVTQTVGDILEDFSRESGQIDETCEVYNSEKIENVTVKMINALKNILNRTDIDGTYIDSGSFKNCHKLTVGGFSYALSTFKSFPIFDKRGFFRESHGKGNEPQNIFTTYKRFSHGRICRPFLANLSSENSEGGFILSKFIEPDHEQKSELGKFQSCRSYLKNIDTMGNSINGIFIEAGGFIKNKRFLESSPLKSDYKKLLECLDANVNLLNTPSASSVESFLINSINNGLDIYDKNQVFEQLSGLPKAEQKIAHRLLKHLKRIKQLKQEYLQKGTLDDIRKLLKEDLCYLYPFDNYSVEFCNKEDVSEVFIGYPQLLTQELEVNNVPDIKTMLCMIEDNYCLVDIDLTQYYDKKDVNDLLKNHYSEIKNWYSFDYLKKFDISPKL